jgi:hypothetical protein
MNPSFDDTMYKRQPSKIKKKLYRSLALTRRLLIELGEHMIDGPDEISPLWFHSTRKPVTYDDYLYAKQSKIKNALTQLKRRRFIEIRKEGDKVWCTLTDKGKAASLRERIRIAEDLPDGYVCMLSFDVPEQERGIRVAIRRQLKDWGFSMDHQSLWTTRKDIFVPFADYLRAVGMSKWFHLYEAKILI